MKNAISVRILSLVLLLGICLSAHAQNKASQYYQLKTYTINNAEQEGVMDAYLRDAYLPALDRAGIPDVGVFKVRPGNYMPTDKIYVLIPFESLQQFEDLENVLAKDGQYTASASPYLDAKYDAPPYERINSVLMRAFSEMPQMRPSEVDGPKKDRVYELRSYESPTEKTYMNKVDMFNAGGEVDLFESLGANAVFYAEVLSGDRMPNLMYMTTFSDMEARDALWEAFRTSPKWTALKADPKYQNNMKKADIMLLYPTEYSDY